MSKNDKKLILSQISYIPLATELPSALRRTSTDHTAPIQCHISVTPCQCYMLAFLKSLILATNI